MIFSRQILFCILLSSFLVSCSEEKKEVSTKDLNEPEAANQLLNPGFFNEENFKNVSFPIWFNSDLIAEKNIKELSLSYHSYQNTLDVTVSELTIRPKKVRTFTFNKNGWVSKYTIQEFYDDKLISTAKFKYRSAPDSMGYSIPTVDISKQNTKNIPLAFLQSLDKLLVFNRLEKVADESKNLKFKETFYVTSHAVLYLTDTLYQNITYLNSEVKPKPEDIIVFGLPNKPQKSFKLENKVELDDIFEHNYFGNGIIESSEFYRDVFTVKRNFSYSSGGSYEGFIDSTFASSDLIQVDKCSISCDSLQIPYQIINTMVKNTGFEQEKSAILVTFTTY